MCSCICKHACLKLPLKGQIKYFELKWMFDDFYRWFRTHLHCPDNICISWRWKMFISWRWFQPYCSALLLMHSHTIHSIGVQYEPLCNRFHVTPDRLITFTRQAALHKGGSHLSEMRNHSCYDWSCAACVWAWISVCALLLIMKR